MTWVKVEDAFTEEDRVLGLSDKAFRLHFTAWCSCSRNLTDGVISVGRLTTLLAQAKATQKHVIELVLSGLWKGSGPYELAGYLDLNLSKEEVESLREERRLAGQKGGQRSAESRKLEATVKANAQAFASSVASSVASSKRSSKNEADTDNRETPDSRSAHTRDGTLDYVVPEDAGEDAIPGGERVRGNGRAGVAETRRRLSAVRELEIAAALGEAS